MASVEENHEAKKTEIMVKAFECFAENGVLGTGARAIGKYCGFNHSVIYSYFKDMDDLIIESTEYCMSKVEDDFMEKAPKDAQDIERFINEVPYWTAEKHGKKYRLMYQVYTHPKYREHGQRFFEGVNRRYTEYACQLSPRVGIRPEILAGFIFLFVRAAVHYALFGDEYYLKMQTDALKVSLKALLENK